MNPLEPTNHRISNSLFESIQNVMSGKTEQVAEAENAGAAVDKAHFCATHVEHALLGKGVCISEQHAEPDKNGNIEWYSVEFLTGIQRVNTSNLKITEGKSHTHGKKMAEEKEVTKDKTIEEALSGNQHKIDANKNNKIDAHDFKLLRAKKKPMDEGNDGNLANNAKPYDKVTHGDVITGRLGKDEMGGKKKKVAEARSTGTAFDWKGKPSELTTDARSAFNKKKISTGTVYSRKPVSETPPSAKSYKKRAVKEGIAQTIINYNDFVLEVTDNPTYGDYLRALQTMVENRDENVQKEVVAIATEAFNEKIDSIISESKARVTFESKFAEIRKTGAKVLGESFTIDSEEAYVEYTVEKDGQRTQYVHVGTVEKK